MSKFKTTVQYQFMQSTNKGNILVNVTLSPIRILFVSNFSEAQKL